MSVITNRSPRIYRSYVQSPSSELFLPDIEWGAHLVVTGDLTAGTVDMVVIPTVTLTDNYDWSLEELFATRNDIVDNDFLLEIQTQEPMGDGVNLSKIYVGDGNQSAGRTESLWLRGVNLGEFIWRGEAAWQILARWNVNTNLTTYVFFARGYGWSRNRILRGSRPQRPNR